LDGVGVTGTCDGVGDFLSSRTAWLALAFKEEGSAPIRCADEEEPGRFVHSSDSANSGAGAFGSFLDDEQSTLRESPETAWAASAAIRKATSFMLSEKDRVRQEEPRERDQRARCGDWGEAAVEVLTRGLPGWLRYEKRCLCCLYRDDEKDVIGEKLHFASGPADALMSICAACVDCELPEADDFIKIEARSEAERSGRPGEGSCGGEQLRERANCSSERSVPLFVSRADADVAACIAELSCENRFAWSAKLLCAGSTGRCEALRSLDRLPEESEETLADLFSPNLDSGVSSTAFETSKGLALAGGSASGASWSAGDGGGDAFRFSRIQRAMRDSISASIHSSTSWRSSFRKLAARFIRESSNDSREVLENVTRISSGGWTESNAKPPRNEPPKGEREANAGRISLDGRTSMVPE